MPRTLLTAFGIDGVTASLVARFREEHALGRPPSFEVDAHFDDYVDPEDLIGGTGQLVYGYEGTPARTAVGVVDEVTVVGTTAVGGAGRACHYVIGLVTPLSLMERGRACAIFQDQTVQQIVASLLATRAPSLNVEWRLTATYAPRAYCVQYEESDLAFLSRLFEHEGIHFFVETSDDGATTLVVSDDSTAAAPIDGEPSLPRRPRAQMHGTEDAIYAMEDRQAVVSGAFVLRDFAFETPDVDLTSTAKAADHVDLAVYDYPGGYFKPDDGSRLATARLEAEQAERETVAVEADCSRVAVGRKLTITNAGSGSAAPAGGEWLVTRVVYEYDRDQPARSLARAELIPARTKFRPARATPRPRVDGPQTATVVAPAGAPAEEIHTDQHARCKVKFHWDLGPDFDDKASAWMRVAQLQTSGSMMLPRVGWEVVVEFLEGDPDRPLVTGRLYNGLFMPPYALPEGKTRTSLQTASSPGGGGTNEIRFEDKAGAEEIMIHAQYDANIVVAHDKTKNVGKNESLEVKVNSSTEVGADQTIQITKGSRTSIGGNQSVLVGMTRKVEVNAVAGFTVGGSSTTTVGAAQTEHIGNPLEAVIALATAKAAEFATAKAAEAIAHVSGAVQGKIDQVLGPVQALAGAAGTLGAHMEALKNGDMAAAGLLLAGASALPGASAVAASMGGEGGGGGGLAAEDTAPGTDASAGSVAAGNLLNAAIGNMVQSAASKAKSALDGAAGVDGDGGGGSSAANEVGPVGDVEGVDATDRAKGPGHSISKVKGSYSETVGAMKVVGTLDGINTNIAGSASQNVGAAHVELVLGDFAEAVQGDKTEKELGLVVLAKGESEHVAGAKTAMVGGAIIDKVKGNLSIEAAAGLTMIAAMHKLGASSSITLKCGASEVTIDGGGVTIKSAMVTLSAGAIQLPKPVAEGG